MQALLILILITLLLLQTTTSTTSPPPFTTFSHALRRPSRRPSRPSQNSDGKTHESYDRDVISFDSKGRIKQFMYAEQGCGRYERIGVGFCNGFSSSDVDEDGGGVEKAPLVFLAKLPQIKSSSPSSSSSQSPSQSSYMLITPHKPNPYIHVSLKTQPSERGYKIHVITGNANDIRYFKRIFDSNINSFYGFNLPSVLDENRDGGYNEDINADSITSSSSSNSDGFTLSNFIISSLKYHINQSPGIRPLSIRNILIEGRSCADADADKDADKDDSKRGVTYAEVFNPCDDGFGVGVGNGIVLGLPRSTDSVASSLKFKKEMKGYYENCDFMGGFKEGLEFGFGLGLSSSSAADGDEDEEASEKTRDKAITKDERRFDVYLISVNDKVEVLRGVRRSEKAGVMEWAKEIAS